MITEDYVSFETAKLLKEKGFDEICYLGYNKNGEYFPTSNRCNSQIIQPDFCFVCCPTLQMAMKWLRKEHNLCIILLPLVTDDDGEGGCLWKHTISMKLKVLFDSENLYESTEIASDDAIKYCLENLI